MGKCHSFNVLHATGKTRQPSPLSPYLISMNVHVFVQASYLEHNCYEVKGQPLSILVSFHVCDSIIFLLLLSLHHNKKRPR